MYQMSNPMFELSAFFVAKFNERKFNWFPHLIEAAVSKKVLLYVYEVMVKDKAIPSIETLPEDEKKLLVQQCRDTGLRFNNQRLIDCAKILHTIKFINSNS